MAWGALLTEGTDGRPAASAAYVPGACNIGPVEIARRRRSGIAGLAVAGVAASALLASGAPRPARLLVALPLAGGLVGLLQARERFCVAFAARGVFDLGEPGGLARVEDPAARAADRARGLRLVARAAAGGAVGAALLWLLPG
ncbi:MAG TPA: hypothetical protein VF763_05710 [Candidatus Limnocylindrales bacterium]